jgi:hypothetical protein
MLGLECLTNDFKKVSPAKTPSAKKNHFILPRTWRALRLCGSYLLPAFAFNKQAEFQVSLGSI